MLKIEVSFVSVQM